MKFVFTDKKVNLPAVIHRYAEKKVGKLDRFFKEDATAAVTFSIERDRNRVEVTIRSGGTIFRASESTSDMHASIDAAVATLERQIAKIRPGWRSGCARGLLSAAWMRRSPLLCPTGRRRGVQPGPQQALSHQAHDPGRGHPSDESAGPQLLRFPGRGCGRCFRGGLLPQ